MREHRSSRVYAALLHLYPRTFRHDFGADMRELFSDLHRAAYVRAGAGGTVRLWLRVIPSLIHNASREHVIALRDRLMSGVPETHTLPPRARGNSMLSTLGQDLRYTARMLRKSPGFTIAAVVVIALGSGAVTTIFSAANAVVFRPLPQVTAPKQLVDIGRTTPSHGGSLTPSYPFFEHVRDENHTLDGVAAWAMMRMTLSTGGEGTSVFGNMVSGNYFRVLGVQPALGRFFSADEGNVPNAHPVLVLSHGFWQRRFGGDSSVVGRTVTVNGMPFTVIGVAPSGFSGTFPILRVDAWASLMMSAHLGRDSTLLTNAGSGWLTLFGRLKPGVSIDGARTDLESIAAAHIAQEPADMKSFTQIAMSRVTGFPADASGALMGFVAVLLVVSGLVMVIASVNVAGMLLARAIARRREIAVRIALGAGRARLVRQMLTESVVLFAIGAAGGLGIAYWSTRLFARIPLPAEVPLAVDLSPDYRVFAFALGVALITGLVFGLAPALQATRYDHGVALRSDTAGAGAHRSRMRNVLVCGQVALSLVLLMSAGLFVRALVRGQQVSPGFEPAHVATADLDVTTSGYTTEHAGQFYNEVKRKLLAVPGVTAVSYSQQVPLTNGSSGMDLGIDGAPASAGVGSDGRVNVNFAIVGGDYLETLRIPVVRGRGLTDADNSAAAAVVVINETFARRYFPGVDPVGRAVRENHTMRTIVGVARDAKYTSLNEDPRAFIYLPSAQRGYPASNILVRTTGDERALTRIIRDAVRVTDRNLPVPQVTTMTAATSVVLLPQRVAASVTGVMGILGLVLAAVGLYGVVAYSVSQRTREIGVRMALGADRGSVLWLIVGEGMRLVGIGMAIGVVIAFGATRAMTQFLFGVSPLDPLVFALIPLALAAAAFVASYMPARRAAQTDPIKALRAD